MAEPLEMLADAAFVMGSESQRSQTQLAASDNLGFQLSVAEKNPLPDLHLAARPDQRLPRLEIKPTRQENFHFPGQMFGSRGSRRRLGMDPRASPEQPGRNDPRVVEDE